MTDKGKGIAVLGSTGSIGCNTLDVIAHHPDRFQVVALAAGRQVDRIVAQARHWRPRVVALADPEAAKQAQTALADSDIAVLSGSDGVARAAAWEGVDMTVSAIVGAAGLAPTLAAIQAGKAIALANKECMVMAGALVMAEAARHQTPLIPVDSEHSAIFQSLHYRPAIRRLILTASGGPFRGWNRSQLTTITPKQALAHPNWDMGPKISIDSATLMNKGLEVIEAHWLFGMPPGQIEVVIHPESIVHSLVDYTDGSVLAQLGAPDMRTPIAVALAWPERIATPVPALDLAALGKLTFKAPPHRRDFPCLTLAYEALRTGGGAPVVLNAANEVAVAAFLAGQIAFLDIPHLIEACLASVSESAPDSLAAVLPWDRQTREQAHAWVNRHGFAALGL